MLNKHNGGDHHSSKGLEKAAEIVIVLTLLAGGLFFTLSYVGERGRQLAVEAKSAAERAKPKPHFVVPNLIEAEKLKVTQQSRPFKFEYQSTAEFRDGTWSNEGQMFGHDTQSGDWIEFEIPSSGAGHYAISVYLTKSSDYGIVQFSVNGKPAGAPIDLFSVDGRILSTGEIKLGTFTFLPKGNRLRLAVVGRNSNNNMPAFQFGIDGIKLEKTR